MLKLVERHIIKNNNKLYKEIDNISFLSKNLYNAGLYEIRQQFINSGTYLNYYGVEKIFKDTNNVDYRSLPIKVSQQILMLLDNNFKSFFSANLRYKENPKKFKGRPKLPKYKDKKKGRNVVTYTKQAISKTSLKKGIVKLSKTNIEIRTKQKEVQQVRIVPKCSYYVIEVVYNKTKSENKLDDTLFAGIDLGLNNLAAVTSNKKGFTPFIINGRPLKSTNQFYNKKKAFLQSKLSKEQYTSKKIEKLTLKRYCKIENYLHKTSRQIIDKLVEENIGNLVIGKNDGWKQKINLGKKNNQNFVQIPYNRFISMLSYKAELENIKVTLQEESYTSKCSFLDNEEIKKQNKYKGKRVKRGLFVSSLGVKINADINASYNIIKKASPKSFELEGVEGVVVHPYRYFSIK